MHTSPVTPDPRQARYGARMTQSFPARARDFLRRWRAVPAELSETRSATERWHAERSADADRARRDSAALLDAVNYSVRHQPLTREKTRVLFLVHHIEAWDSLDGLVRALTEAPDFDVVVASIPRHFRGYHGYRDEDVVHAGLERRGIPHLRFDLADDEDRLAVVRALEPDVIFRQSQWDVDVPEAYSTRNLGFARLCLVPYETMGLIENIPIDGIGDTAVDNRYHRAAWRVFCAGDHARDVAVARSSTGGAQFVATGHPKADRLRTAPARWPVERPDGTTPRSRIVWSAHHSISDTWTSFGMAHLVADEMLAWARSAPDVDFVLMPHPALRPYIDDPSSPVSPDEADRFVAEWTALPNATVFADGDYAPLLAASDAMISDGLSMLVEYQFMQKPLVFLERPGHRPFNEAGKMLLSGVEAAASVDQAREILDSLTPGERESIAQAQRENIARLFAPGPAAPRIVDELRAAVASEHLRRRTEPSGQDT